MKHYLHNSLRALFLSLAVLLSLPMLAEKVEIDGINYDLDAEAKQATVIAKSSGEYSGKVVISESVEHEGITYSVTNIGEKAFLYCPGLTSVTIPNSVTSIWESAFYWCSGLTSVTIGNSVTSIGNLAFSECSALTSVHISDIAAWCNIEFGYYDSNPLSYAHHLYLNGEEVRDLVIPNSVTSIGDNAFYNCSGLTSVTIPNSVTSIGSAAFSGCSGLTSVTIGNSVTSIGDNAFYGCSGLTSVTIPNSVTSIGDNAFDGCSGLTGMKVDANNPKYDSRENCNAIIETSSNTLISGCQTTVIPNSVTSIGRYAFYKCSGLTSVTIPNSVTSIGSAAFSGCSDLTSVTIPNSVTSIGDYAFRGCSGLTSVTIGNSVTSIGDFAFYGCSGLTSVTIGNSVTDIGIYAFRECSGLQNVYCYAENVPSKSSNAFYSSNYKNAILHVPAASIENYKATSPWRSFGKIVALTEEETGIDEVKGENGKVKTAVYDLSGRRVQKGQKGIFIQNGKVMVK